MEAAAARGPGGEAPAAGAWAPCAGRPPVVDASLDLGAPSCRAGGFACLALEATGGRSLLAGGVDGRVSLFDVGAQHRAPRARASARGAARHAHCVAGASWYCADGGAFATCCAGGRARFWDAARLEPVVAWDLGGAPGRDCACAPAAAGPLAAAFAAACGDGSVRLCDPRSGSRADALAALHRGAARCVAWAPDGRLLATGGDDGAVRLWDPRRAAARAPVAALDRHDHGAPGGGGGGAAATARSVFDLWRGTPIPHSLAAQARSAWAAPPSTQQLAVDHYTGRWGWLHASALRRRGRVSTFFL